MVATDNKIVAEKRDDKKGKQAVRKLRNAGRLPGILSLNDGSSREISFDQHAFEMSLRGHGLEGRLLDVEVDGESHGQYVLKDVQHHPVTGSVLHVDFVEIAMGKLMRSATQIVFEGAPAGVEAGGVVEYLLREVEIECLPKNLVESIVVDISGLDIGDALTVGDLDLPAGVELTTAPDIAIISVSAPRVRQDDEEGEGAAAEGDEGADGDAAASDGNDE